MTSTPPPPASGASAAGALAEAALGDLDSGLSVLSGLTLSGLSELETLGLLAQVQSLVARLDSLSLSVVAEAEVRQVCQSATLMSTASWLSHQCRVRPSRARRHVRLANALVQHPELRAALAAGDVSADHGEVIREALAALPDAVPAAVVAEAQAALLEQAHTMDPARLAAAGKHLNYVLDPDGAAAFAREEERLREKAGLTAQDTGTGMVRLGGSATAEQWAWLLAGIEPLAAPVTSDDGGIDPRLLPARRLDALVELVRIAAATDGFPDVGGQRPQLVVTVPVGTLRQVSEASEISCLPYLDLDLPTASEAGLAISPGAARRLACDAHIIPAVLGTAGEPMDVGRAAYVVPVGMRRALILRDRSCRTPGCHRPPRRCHAHHIKHWADGGQTSLQNLVLLCNFHHHEIHKPGGWQIVMKQGQPKFIPPQWTRAP